MQAVDQLQQLQDEDSEPDLPSTGPGNNNTAAAQPHTPPGSSIIRYKACLKNHAASMGGHVFDGCGEFMPSGEEGTPEALKCAACTCHRNFHRKEIDNDDAGGSYYPYNTINYRVPTQIPLSATAMPPPQQQQQRQRHPYYYTHGGAPAESSSEDLNMFSNGGGGGGQGLHNNHSSFSVLKKRVRTKFTQLQRDRMHEFADKIGWRMPKEDEQQVMQFCAEVGVKRQVFKVWMHNNKHALKKRSQILP